MPNSIPTTEILSAPRKDAEWWRTSVIYQIYPRSFADGNGDGMGDLMGVTERLESLAELGVDAIWFSPFFKSPQKDAGYDVADYKDIDPRFGTLEDFDKLVAKAKTLGLRIIVDLVPNHSSDQHAWFQAALKAAPGSPERERYIFRDGKGENGELPPNNWESVFGGIAWTRVTEADGKPGQWYLHIFDSSQPDFNWQNEEVRNEFDTVLRFWLDRGAAGFRIDVAHGMIKVDGLPDVVSISTTMSGQDSPEDIKTQETDEELIKRLQIENPYWGQDGVHEINRRWRKILDEYDERVMCGEAWVHPLSRMARWVRPDEYHQTFNFGYLGTPWDKEKLCDVVTESLN
ncbi:MAG: alpha-amylase family glycosyl hydrolase, partial [Rhodoluna sp.]